VASSRIGRFVCALGLAGTMAGCATLGAGSPSGLPPLDTPEPPPRAVTPLPSEPADTGPTPVIVPAAPSPARVPRPAPSKPASDKPDVPAMPGSVPAAESSARPSAEDAARGASLQTTTHPDEAERRVRELMTRASRDLGQVDPRRLSVGERTQYDAALRFVAQAEEALKARNLRFAEQLADKAAELAAGLRERLSPAMPA
jgi:hypothetical protein